MLNILIVECRYVEFWYAECHVFITECRHCSVLRFYNMLSDVMLNVVIISVLYLLLLSVFMQNVVMLNDVMLIVVTLSVQNI
jgi:hypothetical protein